MPAEIQSKEAISLKCCWFGRISNRTLRLSIMIGPVQYRACTTGYTCCTGCDPDLVIFELSIQILANFGRCFRGFHKVLAAITISLRALIFFS